MRNLGDRPRERPIFQGVCVSPRRQRSWQHCRQPRDLLRAAGGVGSDATSEAVDGRAEPVQLDVVDSRIVDVGWLSRNRSWIRHEGWLSRGFLPSAESSVWRMKDGCGGVEVSDGWGGVGKRLLDGLGNG